MSGPVLPPMEKLLSTFQRAAQRMPAYKALLKECGIRPADVKTIEDFKKLPILDKHKTFQKVPIHQLHLDGKLGPVSWVLTSSGQSGIFSFGLYDPPGAADYKKKIDEALEAVFSVRTRRSLLLNCLPMGVKLYSEYCTLGETSTRSDMACGLMKAFSRYYEQTIIIAETSFMKHLLELGLRQGIDWKKPLVHLILGEEMVAENARRYLEGILGTTCGNLATGLVGQSMGVAELGLNLLFEIPPVAPLALLRRALHDNRDLRRRILGPDATTVPALFNYDPDRIYVEFVKGKLVITVLEDEKPITMVRYTSDDIGQFLDLPADARGDIEAAGLSYDELKQLPIVIIRGRGHCVASGDKKVTPEEIKEGIYLRAELARLTTANFRMIPGSPRAKIRIQLAPDVEPSDEIAAGFAQAIANYATCPLDISCEPYATFGSGMSLDYERKLDYLGK